jgi:hypothetical protein
MIKETKDQKDKIEFNKKHTTMPTYTERGVMQQEITRHYCTPLLFIKSVHHMTLHNQGRFSFTVPPLFSPQNMEHGGNGSLLMINIIYHRY